MENTNQTPNPSPETKIAGGVSGKSIGLLAAGILFGSLLTYIAIKSQPPAQMSQLANVVTSQGQTKTELVATTTPSTTTTQEQTIDYSVDVVAAQVVSIKPNFTFSLAEYPDVKFKILKVSKATGAVKNQLCQTMYGIVVNFMTPTTPPGSCIDQNFKVEGQAAGVVTVELETINNSDHYAVNRFIKLAYSVQDSGQQDIRYAPEKPPFDAYGSAQSSSDAIRLSFAIPENQNTFELLYGTYGRGSGGNYYNDPIKGTSGVISINFQTKTFEKESTVKLQDIINFQTNQ